MCTSWNAVQAITYRTAYVFQRKQLLSCSLGDVPMSGLTMAMCVSLFVRLRRVPFAYAMSRDTGCPEETTLHGVNLHRPAYWRKRGITCDEGTC